LKPSYRAHSGNAGAGGRRTGKSGADVVIEVPLGTTITEFRSKQKDEFADEEDNRDPSVADTFIPKSTKHAKKRDSAISAPSLDYEMPSEEELENMSDAARLDTIEQAHRARFADPREGRPWAEPELPESHPLKESAMQFHKMMESYTDSSGQDAIPKPVFSFDNQLVQGSSDMNIVAPGMEEYYDPEEVAFEDSLSGAELMEKYRLQPPSGREDGVLASNAPRTVELDEAGAYFVAAKGGNGGLGNFRLGAVRNRPQAVGTPGKPGESLMYQLELKLIADVGLVGFPNAGKSTFLSNVSRANPKIASYPFTTLSPEIGTVQLEDFSQFTIADLPGLIEGAHANKGLGHQFLKHIERTTALIYLIDMSGGDNRDPWKSFLTLWDELERYQPGLAKKDAIIVANKMDSGKVAQDNLADFSKRLKAEKEFRKLKIYPVSAASKMNLIPVISALTSLLGLTKPKPTSAQRFSQALRKNNSGVVTMRIGSHFSEAMRNVK
jgi:Obg family GTPase CgtA